MIQCRHHNSTLKGGGLDTILAFLAGTIEVRSFGWNGTTLVNSVITLLTINQGYAAWTQSRMIREKGSTEGVSLTSIVFCFYVFLAWFAYGVHKNSLNLVVNALLFLPYGMILQAAWKHAATPERKTLLNRLILLAVIPLVMTFTAWKEVLFIILLLALLGVAVAMFWELVRAQGVGSADWRVAMSFFVAAIFWFLYSRGKPEFVALYWFNAVTIPMWAIYLLVYLKRRFATR